MTADPLRIPSLFFVAVLLCSQLAAQESATPAPDPLQPPPLKGLQWQLGEWTVKLGGYVKVDLIHDFDAIDSENSFDPRTIPTDGSDDSNTRLLAGQSRLNLDARGPTSGEPLRLFLEGDFYGDGNAFRLRHAYGVLGDHLLAGQTWTNFMDEDMPETLDFESPIGFPQVRQAQVRYTNQLACGDVISFSIEDPASVIVEPATVPGETEEPLPDFTAKYVWNHERGHVQVAGFGGMSSYDPDVGSRDSVALWGVNLSTKLMTWGADYTLLQLTYGDGVGRYRGGITAAPDADGDLEAIETLGVLAAYEHHWCPEYRSTISYSWVEGDLPAGTPPTASEKLSYFAVNFIWQFSDHAWTGIEYLHGTNDTNDGADGEADRLQMSIKFSL